MLAKTGHTILSLLCAGTLFAQSSKPVVEARIMPDSVAIGDQFTMEVTIEKDIVQLIDFPLFDNNKLGTDIEILSESAVDTIARDGRTVKLRKNYLLTTFDEGIYSLGKFPMLYADKNIVDTLWSRDSMFVRVETFAIDTTTQTIYDIKPQINTPVKFSEFSGYITLAFILLQIVAVIIWLIVRHLRRKNGIIGGRNSMLPPHVVAIIALEQLKNQKLWQSNKHKQYYTSLTDIIRIYLEGRYNVGAMEMTSDEILDALKELNLSVKSHAEIQALLRSADLVKFAKYSPSAEENEGAFINAYYFIEESKPSLIDDQTKETEQ